MPKFVGDGREYLNLDHIVRVEFYIDHDGTGKAVIFYSRDCFDLPKDVSGDLCKSLWKALYGLEMTQVEKWEQERKEEAA
jgi:hypothetical protein